MKFHCTFVIYHRFSRHAFSAKTQQLLLIKFDTKLSLSIRRTDFKNIPFEPNTFDHFSHITFPTRPFLLRSHTLEDLRSGIVIDIPIFTLRNAYTFSFWPVFWKYIAALRASSGNIWGIRAFIEPSYHFSKHTFVLCHAYKRTPDLIRTKLTC